MADRWDETMFADDEAEEEEFEASHERLIFLVDASPPMLERCDVRKKRQRRRPAGEGGDPQGPAQPDQDGEAEEEEADEGFEGLTWLGAAVYVAQSVMRQKVIAANADQVAVVLFGTRETTPGTEASLYPNTWVLHKLEAPSAESIAQLEEFNMDSFNKRTGPAGADTSKAAYFKSALWMAVSMVQGKAKQARAQHRVLLFTRDQEPFKHYSRGHDPSQEWKLIAGHLRSLREHHVALELYPMLSPADPAFDLAPFWRGVLLELRGGGDEGDDALEEAEQVGHIGDLVRFVRSKTHSKRALGSFCLWLGPGDEDLRIAVKIYQVYQVQGIPPMKKVSGATAAEVKAETAQLNDFTGGRVEAGDMRFFYPKKPCGLPKTRFTKEELDAIKGHDSTGMKLLGFKPISCLKDYHQVRSSSFIYPDDRKQPGSATAFIALYTAMQQSGTMAICRLAANRARTPMLVALLPAEEVEYEDGTQAEPPGMHAIYLPFSDDLRRPEQDPGFTGTERPHPGEEAIAAAEGLVGAMRLPDFFAGGVCNPVLQRHYEVLEAKALGVEPPPLEELPDGTVPDFDEEAELDDDPKGGSLGAVIQAFKDIVFVGDDEPKKAAAKRKAPEPADQEAVAALGVEDKAAVGAAALKALRNDDLKAWLKAHGCTVGGKKEDLIARIMNKLGL